ncbi:lipid A-modifier LpxR family protein, partial [Stenotrophomonas maltophilia]|uniref:lipid A-modifier LpxR family protein n=3 Tax=Lysobacteraceae TaxID=32033 RepID=UPI003877569D
MAALVFLAAARAPVAQAAEQCGPDAMRDHPPHISFRADNDLFGGRHQDQGYTNGAQLTLVSPNLVDYTDDPCLPRMARWVNQYLEGLHPGRFEQQNMIFSIGQGIFTPTDPTRRDLIEDDRPYAGVLLASFGFNARSGDRLQTTQLAVGVVGPWAQGKQVQDAVHNILGDKKFEG